MSKSEMSGARSQIGQVPAEHQTVPPSSKDKKRKDVFRSAAPISETGESILNSGKRNEQIKKNDHEIVKMPIEEGAASREKEMESISFLFKRFTVTDYSQKSPEVMAKHNAVVVRFPH